MQQPPARPYAVCPPDYRPQRCSNLVPLELTFS